MHDHFFQSNKVIEGYHELFYDLLPYRFYADLSFSHLG